MNIYLKKFDVRWSDIDANRHLANSSFMQYASHTRLSFLSDNGFGQNEFKKYNVGPAALFEQFYYFREANMNDTIYVRLEVAGLSEDGSYFHFRQRFYNQLGKNIALCTVKGVWIDLKTRAVTAPPQTLLDSLFSFPKTEDFKYMGREDVRSDEAKPQHIDPELLLPVVNN